MHAHAIFFPAFAMAVLTFVVSVRMYMTRIGEMKRERIHPQAVATSAQAASRFTDTRAADNFRNLLELPVLFYVALLFAAQTGQVTTTILVLAWSFVALRVMHSYIQCTYNKVMHRFRVYLAGSVALWMLWGVLAVNLMRR